MYIQSGGPRPKITMRKEEEKPKMRNSVQRDKPRTDGCSGEDLAQCTSVFFVMNHAHANDKFTQHIILYLCLYTAVFFCCYRFSVNEDIYIAHHRK